MPPRERLREVAFAGLAAGLEVEWARLDPLRRLRERRPRRERRNRLPGAIAAIPSSQRLAAAWTLTRLFSLALGSGGPLAVVGFADVPGRANADLTGR